jgi:general secretion pathway protein L
MALTTSSARLFGLDLAPAWRSLCVVWRNWPQWPLLRALTPSTSVLLVRADAQLSLWRNEAPLKTPVRAADVKAARFLALEVPEAICLHRRITLPALDETELADAVALEAHSASPFAADDLAWGYRTERQDTTPRLTIDLALTSRKQLAAHMATLTLPKTGVEPEVWALPPSGRPIVLSGFGEQHRRLQVQRWRNVGLGLLLVALGLAAGIAVTPTLQLRLRALQASAAFDAARTDTAALARQREALVQTSERLQTLAQLLNDQPQPMHVLNRVTQMLPDDTWLQTLSVQGTKVSINGQTVDAAALMQDLGKREGVQSVHAPSAAVRAQGANRETFAIEFVLDRAPRPAAAALPLDVANRPSAPANVAPPPAPAAVLPAATPPSSPPPSAPLAAPPAPPSPAAPSAAPTPTPTPVPPATPPRKASPFGMVGG